MIWLNLLNVKVQTSLHICVVGGRLMMFLLYRWDQSTGTALYLAGLEYPHLVSPQGVSLNSKPEADKSKIMATSSNRDKSQERYTRNCATAIMGCKSEGWNWLLLYDCLELFDGKSHSNRGKSLFYNRFKWLNNEAQTVIFYKLVKINRRSVTWTVLFTKPSRTFSFYCSYSGLEIRKDGNVSDH